MFRPFFTRLVSCLLMFLFLAPLFLLAQDLKTIQLKDPDKKRGLPVMEALAVRASVTEWSEKELSLQDLSDLLWAANGLNRPESGKRTASSAMNAQDVDIYVFMKDGVYLYEAKSHCLLPVVAGDHRSECFPPRPPRPSQPGQPGQPTPPSPTREKETPARPAKPTGQQPPNPLVPPPPSAMAPAQPQPPLPAPVILLLVSDISRFRAGSDELKKEWAAIDTGIVSQNISLFCAATGLGTRPRASMDREKIRSLLQLKDSQLPLLNHPVGYKK
ncbi:MAG: nitroreductase family protein [Candidatus Saccharicenans sp.]|nr:nitroreductase family protein [Candidatus Saccharicenans sp.]